MSPACRLLERECDRMFQIGSTFRRGRPSSSGRRSTTSTAAAGVAAEHLLEDAADVLSAEVEILDADAGTAAPGIALSARSAALSSSAEGFPGVARTADSAAHCPDAGMAELVVFLPFARIGQDFVRLLGFLESFGGFRIVLGDVGMEFSSHLAKRRLDLIGRRGPLDA